MMKANLLKDKSAILFDFDGVIADTEQGRYGAYAEILADYGFDLPARARLQDVAGLTGDALLFKFFPELTLEQHNKIVALRQQLYIGNLSHYCRPYYGMLQTVKELHAANYFLALTTANSTAVAKHLLEVVGAAQFFDAVCGREICENPISQTKDYSRVPATINKKIEDCIVVEDSPVGVRGAKKAGFTCVAFEHFENEIIRQNADAIIHNYAELRQLFGLEKPLLPKQAIEI